MTVSLVGRIAIGASRSDFPDLVTHATWRTNEKVTIFRRHKKEIKQIWHKLIRTKAQRKIINIILINLNHDELVSKHIVSDTFGFLSYIMNSYKNHYTGQSK